MAGLPPSRVDDATAAADTALKMRDELSNHRFLNAGQVHMRFGLHTGSDVAGVIGKRKFSYDLRGDTINTASRMGSTAGVDAIQVSQQVYDRLKDSYEFEVRGTHKVKGKGRMTTYTLTKKESHP